MKHPYRGDPRWSEKRVTDYVWLREFASKAGLSEQEMEKLLSMPLSSIKKRLARSGLLYKGALLQLLLKRKKYAQANELASEILKTVGERTLKFDADININENIQALICKIGELPDEAIIKRIKQLEAIGAGDSKKRAAKASSRQLLEAGD